LSRRSCKIGSIVRTMVRINGEQHERSGGDLLRGYTYSCSFGRKLTVANAHVLREKGPRGSFEMRIDDHCRLG